MQELQCYIGNVVVAACVMAATFGIFRIAQFAVQMTLRSLNKLLDFVCEVAIIDE